MDRASHVSILALGCLAAFATACGSSGDTHNSGGGTSDGGSTASGGSSPSTGGSAATGGGSTSDGGSGGAGGVDPGPKTEVHLIGRVDDSDPNGPRFAWPGSAIVTRFKGTSLQVTLNDPGNYFAVVVDGGTPTVLQASGGQHDYPVATGLPDAEHDVWIERRTESFDGITQFIKFTPSAGGNLVKTPEPFARKIEFVGDSITCGYGNLGMGPNCSFSADTEDEYLAWGAVAARALKAEHHGISYSGIGVLRNSGDTTTDPSKIMPTKYERIFADDSNSHYDFAWQPDVVVVDLGTNDYSKGDPGQPYVDNFTAFAKQIRGHYPKALIMLAVGSMLGQQQHDQVIAYFKTIIKNRKDAGDTNLDWVDLGIQDGQNDGLGCDYHPSVKTDQKMADKLVAKLHDKLGW